MESGKKKMRLSIAESFRRKGWRKRTGGSTNRPPADYRRVRPGKKQILGGAAAGIALSAGTAFLFYRSLWGMLSAAFLIPVCLKRVCRRYAREQCACLQQQFKAGMQMTAGALTAGYSIENAWETAERDMARLYGADAVFCKELRYMNQKIRMNEPFEQVLSDFAARSGSEDILHFAEIFQYAKRSGGNMAEIIRDTVARMQEKADVLAEIENAVAAKRAEQRMMNILLPGILLFVTFGSPEYLNSLYKTPPGILVMSICLAGYLAACRWSEKLTEIPV